MAAKCVVCDTDLHCKVEPCEHGESVEWYCPECVIESLCAEVADLKASHNYIECERSTIESRLALAEKVVEAARKQVSKSMSVEMALRAYDAALKSAGEGENDEIRRADI